METSASSISNRRSRQGQDHSALERPTAVAMGERRFQGDPRYDLQNVTDGFASRLESRTHDQADDKALLERICTAYIRATEQQSVIKSAYGATSWWAEQ